MIRGFIQLALGTIGRALLAFYRAYSLPLSTLVVAYGVVILYAHNNLRIVIRQMESMMLEIAAGLGEKPDPRQVLRQFAERWRSEHGDRRLFLPNRLDLWFGSVSAGDLIETLHIGVDYVRIALHMHLGWPTPEDFHPVDYRVWEEYRHRLLIGVRTKLPDVKKLKARYRQKKREGAEREKKARKSGKK
jgi:hypothetical protein